MQLLWAWASERRRGRRAAVRTLYSVTRRAGHSAKRQREAASAAATWQARRAKTALLGAFAHARGANGSAAASGGARRVPFGTNRAYPCCVSVQGTLCVF